VFTAAGRRFPVRPKTLDVRADWAKAAEEAVDRGGWPFPLGGLGHLWLRVVGADVEPSVDVYEPALDHELAEIAAAVDQPARNASLALAGLEPEIVAGQSGRRLDRVAAGPLVVKALAGFERSSTPLPVAVEAPAVTAARLQSVSAQAQAVLSAPVRLTYDGVFFSVEPRELARLLDLPGGGTTVLGIDQDLASHRFENLARGLARPPRNAGFAVREDGSVKVVRPRPGRRLDVAATSTALLAAASRPTNRSAPLAISHVAPELTTKEARSLGIDRQLASYSTAYAGTADRINNLQRAIELLDGARIAPGAVWSFNEQVGERTEARGFRVAPVIINGEYEEEVGGGTSQVATTVFNAAWEAGIKIAERTAHALYISRYPTGRDATVNYPDVDLKLRNDTGHWIVFDTSFDESGILVRLLGAGPVRRVESVAGELRPVGQPEVEREPDPNLLVGQRVVESYGQPAQAVTVERIVYEDGKVLYDETWSTTYRSEPKIVRVGTTPNPVEAKPPPKDEKKKPTKPSGGDEAAKGGG
jgi:vancomycin resistance protein YoaR